MAKPGDKYALLVLDFFFERAREMGLAANLSYDPVRKRTRFIMVGAPKRFDVQANMSRVWGWKEEDKTCRE